MNKHKEELSTIRKRLEHLEHTNHPTLEMCPHCKRYVPMIAGVREGEKFIPSWELFIYVKPIFPHRQCTVCGKIWEHGLREVEVS